MMSSWAPRHEPAKIVRAGFAEEFADLPLRAYPQGSFFVDIQYLRQDLQPAHVVFDAEAGADLAEEFGIAGTSLDERVTLLERIQVKGILQVQQTVGIEVKR